MLQSQRTRIRRQINKANTKRSQIISQLNEMGDWRTVYSPEKVIQIESHLEGLEAAINRLRFILMTED